MEKTTPLNLEIARKVNNSLIGTLDFKDFAKNATEIALNEIDLTAVAIFRIDHNSNELKSYSYTLKVGKKTIDNILGKKFTSVTAPLGRKNTNLVEDTVNEGRINKSSKLEDFSRHVVRENAGNVLQKFLKTKFHISLPIKVNGNVEGVLFCASKDPYFSKEKISLLETVTSQLGLAMGNVMAHERILEKYRKTLEAGDKPKKNRPRIKFTLRITDDLEQYLNYKTINTKTSKAEYVRKMLEDKMKNDQEYEDFTK